MRDDGYTYEKHLLYSTDQELESDRDEFLEDLRSMKEGPMKAHIIADISMIEQELMKRGIL